jgi:hypothetical protein
MMQGAALTAMAPLSKCYGRQYMLAGLFVGVVIWPFSFLFAYLHVERQFLLN